MSQFLASGEKSTVEMESRSAEIFESYSYAQVVSSLWKAIFASKWFCRSSKYQAYFDGVYVTSVVSKSDAQRCPQPVAVWRLWLELFWDSSITKQAMLENKPWCLVVGLFDLLKSESNLPLSGFFWNAVMNIFFILTIKIQKFPSRLKINQSHLLHVAEGLSSSLLLIIYHGGFHNLPASAKFGFCPKTSSDLGFCL